VAEVLTLPFENIRLTSADTELTPPDMGTYSSRVTVAAGNAALKAAHLVKEELFRVVAEKVGVGVDELMMGDGEIFVKSNPERSTSFADAVKLYHVKNNGSPLIVKGSYNSPDKKTPTFSFGAYVCEVEVDLRTGEVTVLNVTAASDCGQLLNPMSVEGQIESCIVMGMGYALSENLILEGGQTVNPSFLGYRIPTSKQTPMINIHHVKIEDPEGPFGAKETGEGSLDPMPPAIANAIYNATGVRIKELPITPEKILRGLKKEER
jgi:4-hydroxybenzoyl-CoA reductase subunit alpha